MTPSWTPPDAEVVSLKEAAVRLGISSDATRKRLERGTLYGEKRGGRWRVYFMPDAMPDTNMDATYGATVDAMRTTSDAVSDSPSALVEALQSQVEDLQKRLDAESEARRRADDRAAQVTDQLIRLTGGLMEQMRELPATVVDVPRERDHAPVRDDPPAKGARGLLGRLRRLAERIEGV